MQFRANRDLCLTIMGFGLREVTAPRACSSANCAHLTCVMCVTTYATNNLCLSCYVQHVGVLAAKPPPDSGRHAAIAARYPVAQTVQSVGKFFNPASRVAGNDWEAHKRVVQASAYMRMMELGFPGMADSTWEPLATIESFLAPPIAPPAVSAALMIAVSGARTQDNLEGMYIYLYIHKNVYVYT